MRPLKLTMSAFGPYAQTEVIDFTDLLNHNLFLVTGPTGSGKTTIFDAICYALFGESSGNVRSADSLRSQFANVDTLTEVELQFELRGIEYHVHRIPKQLKPKSRGEGFTQQSPEATLEVFIDNNPKVITGSTNVSNKVIEIIGITSDQFRQIMMIPQGDFRKLLTSDSKEREKILQKLFDTNYYNQIQNGLKYQADNLAKEIRQGLLRRNEAIKRLEYKPCTNLEVLVNTDSENDVNEIIAEVQKNIADDERVIKDIIKIIEEKQKYVVQLFDKKADFIDKNKKIAKKEALLKSIEVLENQKNDIEYSEKQVEKAEKAAQLSAAEDNIIQRNKEIVQNKEALINIEKKIATESENYIKTEAVFNALKAEEPQRQELQNEISRLRGYENKVKKLDELVKNKTCLKQSLETISSQREKNQLQQKELFEVEKSLVDNINEARDAAIELQKQKVIVKDYRQEIDLLISIEHALKQLSKYDNDKQECERKVSQLRKRVVSKQYQYNKQKLCFLLNQAAVLADELQEGQPCPVCGSVHHPQLANYSNNAVSEAELNRVEKELNQLKNEFGLLEQTLVKYHERVIHKRNEIHELYSKLGTSDSACLEYDSYKKWNNEIICLKQERELKLEEALNTEQCLWQKANSLAKLEDRLQKCKHQRINLDHDCQDMQNKHMKISNQYTSVSSVIEEILLEIPEHIRTLEQLVALITKKGHEYQVALVNFEKSQTNLNKASLRLTELNSELLQISKNNDSLSKTLSEMQKDFASKLQELEFIDINDYHKAKLSRNDILSIKQKISQYKINLATANKELTSLQNETKGLCISDVGEVEQEINECREIINETQAKLNSYSNRTVNNKKTLDRITQINEEIGDKENEYAVIGHLANVANGNNEAKITFERYVLATFLEDILVAANLRLSKMSDERYRLVRSDEVYDKRSQSGLELEVYDNYTGQIRHVKTLSGGESFKASLAMALGLSDVVQSYAGGVQLDTMFIDEGFGTLDPESLDSAINCLIELQESGRLVGIISHVPELKERIGARLEVCATNTGSSTKFVVL